MAAPTSVVKNEVNVGTGVTLIDTNAASRQTVEVYNNGTQAITVVESSSGAPGTITKGIGIVIPPGGMQWFWAGTGIRYYAQVTPLDQGEAAVAQSTGAATWVVEKV